LARGLSLAWPLGTDLTSGGGGGGGNVTLNLDTGQSAQVEFRESHLHDRQIRILGLFCWKLHNFKSDKGKSR
jgi:hypothetical protein